MRAIADDMTIETGRCDDGLRIAGRTTPSRRHARNHAFTLIELMVVLALTAILLVLVFKPLVDAFNLTSRAGTQINSQTAARAILRDVSTALSNAEFVYDNATPSSNINLWLYDQQGNPAVVYSGNSQSPRVPQVPFGMVEFVAPARQMDQNNDPNAPTDPTTGLPIYTASLPAGESGYAAPLSPGRTITRYFIGLRDNTSGPSSVNGYSGMPSVLSHTAQNTYHGYANRWADPSNSNKDNRYTLYRAEFLAFIPDPDTPGRYIPNLKLFHTSDGTKNGQLILDDPNFFYDNGLAGDKASAGAKKWAMPGWKDLVGDGKVYLWENWRAVATTMLPTNTADAIALDRDDNGNIVYSSPGANAPSGAALIPTARTLIRFAPSYIENDPGQPSSLQATGAEVAFTSSPNFTAQHGAWATPYRVLLYRSNGGDPLTQNPLTYYEYYIDPNTLQTKIVAESVPQGQSPAPEGGLADVGPQVNPVNGFFQNASPQTAFSVDPTRGIVNFAFWQWVYCNDGTNPLPQVYAPSAINAGLTGNYQRRYLPLDAPLSAALNPATAQSPLYVFYPNAFDSTGKFITPNVQIVPGTERVYGPDQQPGPHYGYRIQYTRVPANTGVIGPNQYRINYMPVDDARYASDVNDPRVQVGYIEFDSNPDQANFPNIRAQDEDPTPAVQHYRPHGLPELKYDEATNSNVASDPVQVSYQFQVNRPSDVVKIDYLTRELMEVSIQSRLFDPATATPQATDLSAKVKVRNLQR